MSWHYVPYCHTRNKYTQDQIKNMPYGLKCPGCGIMISNEDVVDCTELQHLVSLVKAGGSTLSPGIWST